MKYFSVNFTAIRFYAGIALALLGLVLLAQSAMLFLKSGEWVSLSVLDAIHELWPTKEVEQFFAEWLGLAKILHAIPTFVVPFVLGYFVIVAGD